MPISKIRLLCFSLLSVLGTLAVPLDHTILSLSGDNIHTRYAVHAVHARLPANSNPASSPKKGPKPVQTSKPQSPSNAAPGNPPGGPKSQGPADTTTPTFKIIRVTTPIDTCRLPSVSCEDDYDNVGNLEEEDALVARALEKRGNTREYTATLRNKGQVVFNSLGYPSSSELFKTKKGQALPKTVFDFNDKTSLQDIAVKDLNAIPTDYTSYVTEHIVELQTVKLFLESLSGAVNAIPLSQTVDSPFIQNHWTEEFTVTKVASRTHKPMITKGKRQTLNDLVFEALGSSFNRADFVLCEKEINAYKEKVWVGDSPMNDRTLEIYMQDAVGGALPSTYFLSPIRTTLAAFKYLEHATVARRMQRGIDHVKTELQNIKYLTGKDFTNTAGQVVDVPALWIEFMTKHLSESEKDGKTWLNEQIALAEKLYTAHMTGLKKLQTQLEQDERKTGAAKTQHDTNLKAKLQKLDAELKQKETALSNTKKEEDAARKVVKDIEDKIDKEPKQAQKKAIRTREDLSGKKDALKKKEDASLAALKAKNLKEREIHVLQLQTVNGLIVNIKADQDQLKAYKAAVAAIKMPKAA